ncbi:Similar to S.cerevisiae protein FYV4 (Protein of unknown function) [Malassezia sympodialis ATCC 42132]|uniref:Small ribosomal subunit protein mS41 n=1 Tax=Malassezia sympodialis (strain ATCC 42132) TaxID=1230383 RepID=A0A1M8A0U0_MALS4|nr:Similar to S.cerevisiae protein FYV4 (Protein of unknown function) [Malassezia sympodialis ATCC 42132]
MLWNKLPWTLPVHPLFVRSASSAATRAVPSPRGKIDSPKAFLQAISKPRRDLASNSTCVSAVGEDWDMMFRLTSEKLKGEGMAVKDRKYLLWSLEKFRQGEDPRDFAYDIKKPKKVRGWGPRVQKGYRVRGMLRPGEKKP